MKKGSSILAVACLLFASVAFAQQQGSVEITNAYGSYNEEMQTACVGWEVHATVIDTLHYKVYVTVTAPSGEKTYVDFVEPTHTGVVQTVAFMREECDVPYWSEWTVEAELWLDLYPEPSLLRDTHTIQVEGTQDP